MFTSKCISTVNGQRLKRRILSQKTKIFILLYYFPPIIRVPPEQGQEGTCRRTTTTTIAATTFLLFIAMSSKIPTSQPEHYRPRRAKKQRLCTSEMLEYMIKDTDEQNKTINKCTTCLQTFRIITAILSHKAHLLNHGLHNDAEKSQ